MQTVEQFYRLLTRPSRKLFESKIVYFYNKGKVHSFSWNIIVTGNRFADRTFGGGFKFFFCNLTIHLQNHL